MIRFFKSISSYDVERVYKYDKKYVKIQRILYYMMAIAVFMFNIALFQTPLNAYSDNPSSVTVEDFETFKTIDNCNYSLTATKTDGMVSNGESNLSCITLENQGNIGNSYSYIRSEDFLNEVKYYVWVPSDDLATGNVYTYYDFNKGAADGLLSESLYNDGTIYGRNEYTYLKELKNFDFYTIMKFVPSWVNDNTYIYDLASKGEVYYDVSNPSDAYYRYDTQGNLDFYNKYSEIASVNVDYLYAPGYQIGYTGSEEDTYTSQYVTLTDVKQSEYKLQHFEQTYTEFDMKGNKYGETGFDSSSYFKIENNIGLFYLWDSDENVFYLYSINTLKEQGFITPEEVKEYKDQNLTVISKDKADRLISNVKKYREYYEKYWSLTSKTTSSVGTTTETYIAPSSGEDSYTYYVIDKTPTSYDAIYNYNFTYITEKMYQYSSVYLNQLYEYTVIDQTKVDTITNQSIYSFEKTDTVETPSGPLAGYTTCSSFTSDNMQSAGLKCYNSTALGRFDWSISYKYPSYTSNSNFFLRKGDNFLYTSSGSPLTFTGTSKSLIIDGVAKTAYLASDNNYYYETGTNGSIYLEKVTDTNITLRETSSVETTDKEKDANAHNSELSIDMGKVVNGSYGSSVTIYTNRQQKEEEIFDTYYTTNYKKANFQSENTYAELTENVYSSVNTALSKVNSGEYFYIKGSYVDTAYQDLYYRPKYYFFEVHTGWKKYEYYMTETANVNKYSMPGTNTKIKDYSNPAIFIKIDQSVYESGQYNVTQYVTRVSLPVTDWFDWGTKHSTVTAQITKYNTMIPTSYNSETCNRYDSPGGVSITLGKCTTYTTSSYTSGSTTTSYYNADREYNYLQQYEIYRSTSTNTYNRYKYSYYTVSSFTQDERTSYKTGSTGSFSSSDYYVVNQTPYLVKNEDLSYIYYVWTKKTFSISRSTGSKNNTRNYYIDYKGTKFYYNSSNSLINKSTTSNIYNLTWPTISQYSKPSGYNYYSNYSSPTSGKVVYSNCGTTSITNDCSIQIKNFSYDSNGLAKEVRGVDKKINSIEIAADVLKKKTPVEIENYLKTDSKFTNIIESVTWENEKFTINYKPSVNPAETSFTIGKITTEYIRYEYYTSKEDSIIVNKPGANNGKWVDGASESEPLKTKLYNNEGITDAKSSFVSTPTVKTISEATSGSSLRVEKTVVDKTTYTQKLHRFVGMVDSDPQETVTLYNSSASPSVTFNNFKGYTGPFTDEGNGTGSNVTLTQCSSTSTDQCYRFISSQRDKELKVEQTAVNSSVSYTEDAGQSEDKDFSKTSGNKAYYANHLPKDDGFQKRLCTSDTDVQCYILNSTTYEGIPRYKKTTYVTTYTSTLANTGNTIQNGQSSANSSINSYFELGVLNGAEYDNDWNIYGGSYSYGSSSGGISSLNKFNENAWFLTNTSLLKRYENSSYIFNGNGTTGEYEMQGLTSGKTYYVSFIATGSNSTVSVYINNSLLKTFNASTSRQNVSFVASASNMTIKFGINGEISLKQIAVKENTTYTPFVEFTLGNVTDTFYQTYGFEIQNSYYDVDETMPNNGYALTVKTDVIGYAGKEIDGINGLAQISESGNYNKNNILFGADFDGNGTIDEDEKYPGVTPALYFDLDNAGTYRYLYTGKQSEALTYELKRHVTINFATSTNYLAKKNMSSFNDVLPSSINGDGSFNPDDATTYVLGLDGAKYSINSARGLYFLAVEVYGLSTTDYVFDTTSNQVLMVRDFKDYYKYMIMHDDNKTYDKISKTSTKLDKGFTEEIVFTVKGDLDNIINSLTDKDYINSNNVLPLLNSGVYTLTQERLKALYEEGNSNFIEYNCTSDDNCAYSYDPKDYIITLDDVRKGYVEGVNNYGILIDNSLINDTNNRFTYNNETYKFVIKTNENGEKVYQGFTEYKEYYFGGEWVEKTTSLNDYFQEKGNNYALIDKLYNSGYQNVYLIGNKIFVENINLYILENTNGTENSNGIYSTNENEKYFYVWATDSQDITKNGQYKIVKKYSLTEVNKLLTDGIVVNGKKLMTRTLAYNDIKIEVNENFFKMGNISYIYKLNIKTSDNIYVNNILSLSDLEVLDLNDGIDSNAIAGSLKSYKLKFSGMLNYWESTLNGSKLYKEEIINDEEKVILDIYGVQNKTSEITIDGETVSEFIMMNTGKKDVLVNGEYKTQSTYDLYGLEQVYDDGNYYMITDIVNDLVRALNILKDYGYTGYMFSDKKDINSSAQTALSNLSTSSLINWSNYANTSRYKLSNDFKNSSLANLMYQGTGNVSLYNASTMTETESEYFNRFLYLYSFYLYSALESYYSGVTFGKETNGNTPNIDHLDDDTLKTLILFKNKTVDKDYIKTDILNSFVQLTGINFKDEADLRNKMRINYKQVLGTVIDPYLMLEKIFITVNHRSNAEETMEVYNPLSMQSGLSTDDLTSLDYTFTNLLSLIQNATSNEYIFVKSEQNNDRYYVYRLLEDNGAKKPSASSYIRQNSINDYNGLIIYDNFDTENPVYRSIGNYYYQMGLRYSEKQIKDSNLSGQDLEIEKIGYAMMYKGFYTKYLQSSLITSLSNYVLFNDADNKEVGYSPVTSYISDYSEMPSSSDKDYIFISDEVIASKTSTTVSISDNNGNYVNLSPSQETGYIIDRDGFKTEVHNIVSKNIAEYTVHNIFDKIEDGEIKLLNNELWFANDGVFYLFDPDDYPSSGAFSITPYDEIYQAVLDRVQSTTPEYVGERNYYGYSVKDVKIKYIANDEPGKEYPVDLGVERVNGGYNIFINNKAYYKITGYDLSFNMLINTYVADESNAAQIYSPFNFILYIEDETTNGFSSQNHNSFDMETINNITVDANVIKDIENDTNYENINTSFNISIPANSVTLNNSDFGNTKFYEYSLSYEKPSVEKECATGFIYHLATNRCYLTDEENLNIVDNTTYKYDITLKTTGDSVEYYSNKEELSLEDVNAALKSQLNITISNLNEVEITTVLGDFTWNIQDTAKTLTIDNLPQNKNYTLYIRKRLNNGFFTNSFKDEFTTGNDMVRNPYGTSLANIEVVFKDDVLLRNEYIPYDLQQGLFELDINNIENYDAKSIITGVNGYEYEITNKYRAKLSIDNKVAIAFALVDTNGNIVKFGRNYQNAVSFVRSVNDINPQYHIDAEGNTQLTFGSDGLFYYNFNETDLIKFEEYSNNFNAFVDRYLLKEYIIKLSSDLYSVLDEKETYTLKAISVHDNRYSYLDYNQNYYMDEGIEMPEYTFYDKNGMPIFNESTNKILYKARDIDLPTNEVKDWHSSSMSNFNEFKISSYTLNNVKSYYLFAYNKENGSHIVK